MRTPILEPTQSSLVGLSFICCLSACLFTKEKKKLAGLVLGDLGNLELSGIATLYVYAGLGYVPQPLLLRHLLVPGLRKLAYSYSGV
jgi:hypothetical protein